MKGFYGALEKLQLTRRSAQSLLLDYSIKKSIKNHYGL